MRLLNFEPLNDRFGGNYEQGRVGEINEANLANRPLPLRIIYRTLFSDVSIEFCPKQAKMALKTDSEPIFERIGKLTNI